MPVLVSLVMPSLEYIYIRLTCLLSLLWTSCESGFAGVLLEAASDDYAKRRRASAWD